MKKKAIYWFRKNLRLRDNPSLVRASKEVKEILPVYIIDVDLYGDHDLGFKKCGAFRWNFMMESIKSLKAELQSIGLDLLLLEGNPVKKLLNLTKNEDIDLIYTSKEVDFNEIAEENELAHYVTLSTEYDQLLFEPNLLPFEIKDLPFIFTDFRKLVEKRALPRREASEVNEIKLLDYDYSSSIKVNAKVVKLDSRSAFRFQGGEDEAWNRLNQYFWETGKLSTYKYTRNGLIGVDYSSKFSPFLALGAISPVSIYNEVKKFELQRTKNISTYWIIFELLWREFFKYTSLKFGNKLFRKSGIRGVKHNYINHIQSFQNWINGNTGDEFVDANMLELKYTGFMSNRGRQNVASYLTQDLNIDWRWGASYFESQLIDYDCASNWCNWMYVAGVGNDPRSRKFNTKMQAERYDKKAKYRDMWLNPSLF